MEDIM